MLRSETVRTDGAVLLKGLLEPERLRNIRRAYRPVLTARIDRAGPDRGPERYYATPPFVPPFFDPKIFQQPDILGIVRRLVGEEPVMCQWAADTPLPGSEYQEVPPPKVSLAPCHLSDPATYLREQVHRDAAPLYPDHPEFPAPPATQLAVNFPLVDVLPPDGSNGPSNGPTVRR